MRYYLDTNILVFAILGQDNELSRDVRALLADYAHSFMTSTECVRELIHLVQIGKISMPKGTDAGKAAQAAVRAIVDWGIKIVPVSMVHLETLAALPLYDDHRDPADRLIIAQAIADRVPLVRERSLLFPKTSPFVLLSPPLPGALPAPGRKPEADIFRIFAANTKTTHTSSWPKTN